MTTIATATATRFYALIAAVLFTALAVLAAPTVASHLAPASHQGSSVTATSHPDNVYCRHC
jgi:hypothetical protein